MPLIHKKVKARKTHKCSHCDGVIEPKSCYEYNKIAWFKNYQDSDDTGFMVLKHCEKCCQQQHEDEE